MEEIEQTEEELDLPRWIGEKENCLWCNKLAPLSSIEPLDTDQGLLLKYECANKDCEHLERFGRKATYSLCLEDPRYFMSYEEWKKKKEEEKEKKPDETIVPVSVNGKGEKGV